MFIRNSFLVLFLTFLVTFASSAQRGFEMWAVAGFNAAQIEGDGLAGFDKIGLNTGLKLGYELPNKWMANLELLYSQKGSKASSRQALAGNRQSTHLDYFEIPVYVTYNDWYQEKEQYYKVGLHGGLSYAYLFNVRTQNIKLLNGIGNFKRYDLSAFLGLHYAFNARWSLILRYTNSFIRIWENENLESKGLLNYQWTFRADYHF